MPDTRAKQFTSSAAPSAAGRTWTIRHDDLANTMTVRRKPAAEFESAPQSAPVSRPAEAKHVHSITISTQVVHIDVAAPSMAYQAAGLEPAGPRAADSRSGTQPASQHPCDADLFSHDQQPPGDEPVLDPEWDLADLADFFGVATLF